MQRWIAVVFLLFGLSSVLLSGSVEGVVQHPKFKTAPKESIIPNRYFIEFTSDDVALGDGVVNRLKKRDMPNVQFGERLTHPILSGIPVHLKDVSEHEHDDYLYSILNMDQVAAVYPSRLIRRATDEFIYHAESVPDPQTMSSILPHTVTQVNLARETLNVTGRGIVVGLIDTGVDYNHPALGGGFGPGYKVRYGHDLVGNTFNGDPSSMTPDNDPMDDCDGHGTHVAGIVAGYDPATGFTGAAPEVTLGMWRVFGCGNETSATSEILAQAILMAYDANCDIVSMSASSATGWETSLENVVAQRLIDNGVIFVSSQGNNGKRGAYYTVTLALTDDAMTVGSVENEYFYSRWFRISDTPNKYVYTLANTTSVMINGTVVFGADVGIIKHEGCHSAFVHSDVRGKIGLVTLDTNTCPAEELLVPLQAAGAIGAIVVYYPSDDIQFPHNDFFHNESITIPVVAVSREGGEALVHALWTNSTVNVTFSTEGELFAVRNSNTISAFSTIGPTMYLNIKPDISAVGGYILSTAPSFVGDYQVFSGTSMSTPQMAGAFALYLEARKSLNETPVFIKEQFQNYAYKVHYSSNTDNDSPIRQGAGLVQVYDAITQYVHVSPGRISFNDTASSNYKSHQLTITNHGQETASYTVHNNVSVSIIPYDPKVSGYSIIAPGYISTAAASLHISPETVVLGPGESATVQVDVIPPDVDPALHTIYGGYVQFQPHYAGGKPITVPYIGVVGSQQELPIFNQHHPLCLYGDYGRLKYSASETYHFNLSDPRTEPYIGVSLWTSSASLVADVIDAESGRVYGYFPPFRNHHPIRSPNNECDGGYWSGTYLSLQPAGGGELVSTALSPGNYRLRFSALRVWGNPENPNDWEIHTTGNIVITT